MKVLHLADLHLGKLIRGRSRKAESEVIVDRLLAAVDEHQPSMVVAAGDTFDTSRPGPHELHTFARLTAGLSKREVPLKLGSGNHDGPTTMSDVLGKTAGWIQAMGLKNLDAYPSTQLNYLDLKGDDIMEAAYLLSLPYPHRRSFDDQLDKSLRDRTESVSQTLEDSISGLYQHIRGLQGGHDLPIFLMAHMSTLNAELSEEQAMRLGWDVTVRSEVLEPFTATFLGHIHRQQRVAPTIWYAGSPWYGDFGETTHPKGFLLWDIGDTVTVSPISSGPMPFTRFSDENVWPDPETPGYIRCDTTLNGAQLRSLRRELSDLYQNAQGIWVDAVKVKRQMRARAPELASPLSTPADQVGHYLDMKGIEREPHLSRALRIMADVDG